MEFQYHVYYNVSVYRYPLPVVGMKWRNYLPMMGSEYVYGIFIL
jgi:hypothetical protein